VTSTTISAPRRGRRILTALSTVAATALLSGCALFSPMATEIPYNPGDGVGVSIGDVEVRDLIVIGTEEGAAATVSAYVVNNSADEVTVGFQAEGASPATVDVPPNSALQVSPPGERGLTIDSLPVAPGAVLPLAVQVGDNPPAQVGTPTVSTSTALYTDFGSGEG
jgi:hypothetical protein